MLQSAVPDHGFPWRMAVGVFLVATLALHINGRSFSNGETVPYRYLPIAVLRHHTFRLDAFPHLNHPSIYAVIRDKDGHLVSKKTALPALVEVPFFAGYALIKGELPSVESDMILLGNITMSTMAAFAAVFLAAALRPVLRRRWLAPQAGIGLIVLTPFWFAAKGAWVHPLLGLFNAASLYMMVAGRNKTANWGWIGILQGLAVATRIGCIPTALVFLVSAWFCPAASQLSRRRRLGAFILGSLPGLIFLASYNFRYFGHFTSTAFGSAPIKMIRLPFEGFAGLLISPGEGIFLFSPVLLLGLVAFRSEVRRRWDVRIAFVAMCAHLLYWSCYLDWWGGSAWGPRYLFEALPFAIYITASGLDSALSELKFWKRPLAVAAGLLCVVSLSVQAIGMFTWNNTYHQRFDPGFWVNEGQHWAWKAPYEPWWSLRNLPIQKPKWMKSDSYSLLHSSTSGEFPTMRNETPRKSKNGLRPVLGGIIIGAVSCRLG